MKILFISDIHGIDKNLKIIDDVIEEEKIQKLVVLGDLYCGGVDKSIENFMLKHKDILICMKGNCDRESICYSSPFLIIKDLSVIATDNIDIYITHGDRYNRYSDLKVKDGILVYGHEHIPYIIQDDNMIYICVGSISIPRGESMPSYMIYDNKKFTIYDVDKNILFEKIIRELNYE